MYLLKLITSQEPLWSWGYSSTENNRQKPNKSPCLGGLSSHLSAPGEYQYPQWLKCLSFFITHHLHGKTPLLKQGSCLLACYGLWDSDYSSHVIYLVFCLGQAPTL